MQRLFRFLLIPALLLATSAQAQVAAPDFLPAAPRYFLSFAPLINGTTLTPDNPAAQQWGGPSRIVLGTMRLAETVGTTVDYSGSYGGGRLVRPGWSAGVDYSDAKGPSQHERTAGLSLSGLLGDSLAVGYGYESYQEVIGADHFKDNALGLSWRLGKSFYLGAGASASSYENGLITADRKTTMYGAALRTEGDTRWYIAYDVLDKDDFSNGVLFGVKESTAALQAAFGGLVIGASQIKIDVKGSGATATEKFFDIGWVPPKGGVSVVLHSMNGSTSAGQSGKGTNLTLAYLF
jgi:hypothetical protein